MPALDGAFALAQMHGARCVGQDLDFDVPGTLDQLFEIDAGIAERLPRFACCRFESRTQLSLDAHDAHPLAASAGSGLHHHRIPELAGNRCGLGQSAQ